MTKTRKTVQTTTHSELTGWITASDEVLQKVWENESDETWEKYLTPNEKKRFRKE